MQFKRCFKCGSEKSIDEFYKHSAMGDGHLGKCKECTKADTLANRMAKIEYYRSFDRARSSAPHRVAARRQYMKTVEGQLAHARAAKKWDVSNAIKKHAQSAVGKAVRDGKLVRQPCFICGEKAHAHHPDYNSPLDVVWLCPLHHKQAHALVKGPA